MKNSIKRNLFYALNELSKVHDKIIKSVNWMSLEERTEILGDCQNLAVQIGETIEDEEGEGTTAVTILEEYCEELYQFSQLKGKLTDTAAIYGKLQNLLTRTKRCIIKDIPVRYEVVFFPYKASMWDSLESVWKAAMEDPETEALVVPIPYYVMHEDQTLGDLCYEGDSYPDYVTVIPWEQYRLEEHRPDAIFIHNPYDNCNAVTRVPTEFYASNLINYTDLLVYIPYFISLEDVESHFCVLPGTIYADKVIVESEKIKTTYIKNFEVWVKENHLHGKFSQYKSKFLPLGSPKLEKAVCTYREMCSVPEAWRNLMVGDDGSRKKIILYNTTISALLSGNEQTLKKIEAVLSRFEKERRYLLLWRPHPLSGAAYRAMRGEFVERYKNLVEGYREAGWGIYDDTPDLNRAIAISDAYYGDWSSVVALYRVTGKPVLILDIYATEGGCT